MLVAFAAAATGEQSSRERESASVRERTNVGERNNKQHTWTVALQQQANEREQFKSSRERKHVCAKVREHNSTQHTSSTRERQQER